MCPPETGPCRACTQPKASGGRTEKSWRGTCRWAGWMDGWLAGCYARGGRMLIVGFVRTSALHSTLLNCMPLTCLLRYLTDIHVLSCLALPRCLRVLSVYLSIDQPPIALHAHFLPAFHGWADGERTGQVYGPTPPPTPHPQPIASPPFSACLHVPHSLTRSTQFAPACVQCVAC